MGSVGDGRGRTRAPTWPFVGREQALDLVGRTLVDPTAPSLLVRGIAGIGKTALVNEAVARAGSDGRRVLRVTGRPNGDPLPLGSLSASLPSLSPDPGTALAPALARAVRRVEDDGWEAVCADDVSGIDAASAQVLQHLAAAGLPLVATARTGDPLPESVVALRVVGTLEVLALGALADAEVTSLVERVLGEQVDEATSRRFALLSEGSPLHLRELLRAAVARDVLRRAGGILRWDPSVGGAWALGGLVRERLAHQSDDVFHAAALVAVGGDLPAPVLTDLVGRATLTAARAAELIDVDVHGTVAPAHPLIAEVLLDGLDPDRQRALHHDLAESLGAESLGDWAPGASLRAIAHRQAAGDPVDSCLLIDAGEEALRRSSPEVAIRLFAAAVDAGVAEARVGLGDALAALGADEDAATAYRAALEAGLAHGSTGRATLGMHVLRRRTGPADADRSRALVALADTTLDDDLARALRVEGARGLLDADLAEDAIGAARPVLDDPDATVAHRVGAAATIARADAHRGRALHGLAVLEAARTALVRARAAGSAEEELDEATIEVLDLLGDARLLERFGDERLGRIRRSGPFPGSVDLASEALGLAALAAGEPGVAVRALRATIGARHGRPGSGRRTAVLRARLAEALALDGQIEDGWRELDGRVPAELPDVDDANHARARALLQALDGEVEVAAAEGALLVTRAVDAGLWGRALALGHLVWRAASLERPFPGLHEAAERSEGPWAAAVARQLDALRTGDGEESLAAADAFVELGRCVDAAEASADAAAAWAEAGSRRAAIAAALRSDELLARSGLARPLRRTPPIELPTLTPRELEIALLVSEGRSNRAIAEQLVLSVRTVEGHILRASAKLGVDAREALGDVVAGGTGGPRG